MRKLLFLGILGLAVVASTSSCKRTEKSSTTGIPYNSPEYGGFEKNTNYEGQATGPNLVFIEGGRFTMGQVEQDVMFNYNSIPRTVSVPSFYMDETEIANIDYREYLWWIKRVYQSQSVYDAAVPDTLVWREELAYNEPLVETYFRHPSYDDYPVVGVSWIQANEYCKWRTDRVNEMILIERGVLDPATMEGQTKASNFTTGSYLTGNFEGTEGSAPIIDPKTGSPRRARFSDGILLPDYRLPTETEWEFAALALIGNQPYARDERYSDRRIYPWDGKTVRYARRGREQGRIIANFKRGAGDYMGVAGALNDNAHITAPVRSFLPNDFGLYNMAGNVSEWVQDVYRPLTSMTLDGTQDHELSPFRGNIFYEPVKNGDNYELDSLGRIKYQQVTDKSVANRTNYQTGDAIDYKDGDEQSRAGYGEDGIMTLITNKSRVYKGGSWADRAYYLSPGTRRFLDEEKASRTIGFRCAMTRMGSPSGNQFPGGNQFRTRKRRSSRRY